MIYVFMGKSSVGKDHIVKELLKSNPNVKLAVSHTTRPMRNGETNGLEYHFIDKKTFLKRQQNGYFIETRKYDTFDTSGNKDTWYYGLSYDALKDSKNKDYIVILDLKGLNELVGALKDDNIEIIYIKADRTIRIGRALNREGKMNTKQIKEVERRFVADDIDFPDSLLENMDMYTLSNNNLGELYNNLEFINRMISENK